MSERGSFVTEFIYCHQCFESAKKILLGDDKYLDSSVIKDRPIIAGKIGGLYSGEELVTFEFKLIPQLEEILCHDLRIAVLSDSGGENIFRLHPQKPNDTPTQ